LPAKALSGFLHPVPQIEAILMLRLFSCRFQLIIARFQLVGFVRRENRLNILINFAQMLE
jgi:hypothetical protein